MKSIFYRLRLLGLICLAIGGFACQSNQQVEEMTSEGQTAKSEVEAIFPKGNLGPAENFTGNAYAYSLVPNDSMLTTLVGNVYFEPGARSNWHIHPGGQILIITSGSGFHQIEGQPKQALKKGDTVTCPPNVRHWHGASPTVGMQQLYIIPNTEKGIVEWKEEVTDEQYGR